MVRSNEALLLQASYNYRERGMRTAIFIASFDEVVIALFIVGGDSSTLTRRMFANIRDQIDPTVAAVSTLMILLSILLLVLMQYIKGMEKRRQRVSSVG